jgi:RHS repeat-associated protein
LPFGEDWVDQRTTSWNAPYTFSGKEKDVETGYGYFGARYYDSGLSIWLSVDPMSDKYPSLSPYNYCANNPVILVDPDGRDIWDVDENGIIVNRHKDKTKDVIRRVDSNGNPIEGEENSVTFKYRTIKERNHTVKVKGDDGIIVPKTLKILEVQGDENALSAFKFLIGGGGENQVEWGLVRIGKEGSGRNLLGTGNETETSYMAGYALAWKYTIREDNHNHPDGTRIPSESDIETAKAISDKFKNARFNLYISPKAHPIQYNKNSIYVGRDGRIHPGKTY